MRNSVNSWQVRGNHNVSLVHRELNFWGCWTYCWKSIGPHFLNVTGSILSRSTSVFQAIPLMNKWKKSTMLHIVAKCSHFPDTFFPNVSLLSHIVTKCMKNHIPHCYLFGSNTVHCGLSEPALRAGATIGAVSFPSMKVYPGEGYYCCCCCCRKWVILFITCSLHSCSVGCIPARISLRGKCIGRYVMTWLLLSQLLSQVGPGV